MKIHQSRPDPTFLNLDEQFPHLIHAPIVEAIVEVRTQAGIPWEENPVSEKIKKELSDYPDVQSLKMMQHELKVTAGQRPEQAVRDLGWRGLRCETEDKLQVAQFYRDGFTFSRLQPYENWDIFCKEAMRLWRCHQSIAKPEQVDRLGIRFINRIRAPQHPIELDDYLTAAPQAPAAIDFPFVSFLHQDSFQIPEHPYRVDVVKTVQEMAGTWLILDIDVFTTQPIDANKLEDLPYLREMRWLKNKFFFSSITEKVKGEVQ
ncbi:MAG: TIGR04255 family protein [Mariprofundales bacterium]|nr:TIGR04255 family protein [Mariprofundales bacterium]